MRLFQFIIVRVVLRKRFYRIGVLLLFIFLFGGCYSMPSHADRFLKEYNARNPLPPAQEDGRAPLENFQPYQEQALTCAQWQQTVHYREIMKNNDMRAKNIRHILDNLPEDNVLRDRSGNEVLRFTGIVHIDSIGAVEFPVIYPGTNREDSLSVLETLNTLQGNVVYKQMKQ